MDIEKLIERLKHNYHGYSTVENNPEETFHDMVECLTALSTLQAENEKLREMYQKEKAVCHAVQAELENYRKGHCAEGGCAAEKDRDAVLAELERVKRERDAAVEDLHKLCPAWKWDGEPSNLLTVPFTAGRQTPGCGLFRLSGSTARRRDRYIGNGGDQNGATDI